MSHHRNGWKKTGILLTVLAAAAGGLIAGTAPATAAPRSWPPATPSARDLVVDEHTTPADQGGFTHVVLLHVTSSGFRFSVEPVLPSITVATATPIAVGAREPLSASGSEVGGAVPIADPASHVWTSSDPRVATVDSRTGVVTGHRPGTAVVSVRSGGVAGSVGVTVK